MNYRNVVSISAVAGVLLAVPVAALADTVTIRADAWFPMNADENADRPGYMIELAEAVFSPQGYEVDYQNLPWERALQSVRNGDYDCVVGAYNSDAPDFVFPDTPWGSDQSVFYVKSGTDWRYDGLASLDDIVVATIGGYAYGDDFDEYAEDNPERVDVLNANNALEQNIRKVAGDRVDALLESPPVLEAQLERMGMQGELEPAGELGPPHDMYIACSPANEERSRELMQMVDEGTRELRESGELGDILSRYGVEDWHE